MNTLRSSLDVETYQLDPNLAERALLDPATMPDVYAMVMENALPMKDLCAGDVIIVDHSREPEVGDAVLVYLRHGAAPADAPQRLVAELATAIPPRFHPNSEVHALVGLYLNAGAKAERMAHFLRAADVLAVHRVDAAQRRR